MRRAATALTAALSLLAAGCYDFASPLDATPQLPIESALIGEWRCLVADPDETQQAFTLSFVATGERTYDIIVRAEEGKEPERVSAYPSRLGKSMFLNLRDLNPQRSSKPWTLLRYSFLRPNVLRFETVDDVPIREDATPADLRRDLVRVGEDVYSDVVFCVRAAKRK